MMLMLVLVLMLLMRMMVMLLLLMMMMVMVPPILNLERVGTRPQPDPRKAGILDPCPPASGFLIKPQ